MARRPRQTHYFLYDWFAPLYDLGVWMLGFIVGGERKLREKVIAELTPLKGARTLEIFSGTATLSLMAARMGANVTALDISGGMLGVAKEKARDSGLALKPVRGDAEDLPFIDSVFDRVIASMGFHEMPEDKIPAILTEAYRVLKKGGRLVIFDFSKAEGITEYLQSVFFTFFEGDTARAWVRMDLQGLFGSMGFEGFKRKFLFRRSFQLVTVLKK